MKIHDISNQIGPSDEFIFGAEHTGSHACYLIYGTMGPGEKGRKLKAGKGHEEIFLAVSGDFILTNDDNPVTSEVKQGQAFHIAGEATYWLENATDAPAVYVMAGGHSHHGHH